MKGSVTKEASTVRIRAKPLNGFIKFGIEATAKNGFITFDMFMNGKMRSSTIIYSKNVRDWQITVWHPNTTRRFAFTVERHGLRIQFGSLIITRSLLKGYLT